MAPSYALPPAPAVASSRSPDLRNGRPMLKSRNTSLSLEPVNTNLASIQSNSHVSIVSSPQLMEPAASFSNFKKKTRPRGESDLGRPPIPHSHTNGFGFPTRITLKTKGLKILPEIDTTPENSSTWVDVLLTAVLVPTPFLLSALLKPPLQSIDHSTHSSSAELAEEVLQEVAATALPIPTRSITLVQACALTSATLLVVGLLGHMQLRKNTLDRRKSFFGKANPGDTDRISFGSIKKIFSRMLCVGLPFLAMVEIGGVRTGFILLTALASGILCPENLPAAEKHESNWRRAISTRRWTCAFFVLSLIIDLVWLKPGHEVESTIRGYIALTKSLFLLPLPLAARSRSGSTGNISRTASFINIEAAPMSAIERGASRTSKSSVSSLFNQSAKDVRTTLISGGLLAIITLLLTFLFSITILPPLRSLAIFSGSVVSAAALIVTTKPRTLRTTSKSGLGIGLAFCIVFGLMAGMLSKAYGLVMLVLATMAYVAVRIDTSTSDQPRKITPYQINPQKHHHHHVNRADASTFTNFLLRSFQNSTLVYGILSNPESRKIVYFMFINFGFMFIQTFYALISGSLGLLSDSIHMFFDCVGLLAGLIASVMSKWPPSARFPYGYGKVETLSGLGNGIFLMIISVEIIWESFERFIERVEINRISELLAVSVAGLAVNLVGLFFIGHAHHGHGHGHDHHHHHGSEDKHTLSHGSGHTPSIQIEGADFPTNPLDIMHHGHSHSNENMAGIYLHILADTMGSVAVIVSTLLTAYTGWSGWDPIASCIIAILIIAASIPLVIGSANKLLLTVSGEIEYSLRNTLQELSMLRGVIGYTVPRFWLDDKETEIHEHDHGLSHGHDHSFTDHDHAGHSHVHEHDHHKASLSSHEFSPLHTHHEHDQRHVHETHNHGHDHVQTEHSHDSHNHTHQSHNHGHQHKHKSSHDFGQAPLCAHDEHDHEHEHEHDHDHAAHSALPRILGVIHVTASILADLEDVRQRCESLFKSRNMNVLVQVDREGQGVCWCGGDKPRRGSGLNSPMFSS